MKFEDQRKIMTERQIKGRGIYATSLLNAFSKVPRDLFVPEEMRRFAYQDAPLSIGKGQTISQPYIIALMLDLLRIQPKDKVLEIGTGSGYQTALLAEVADEVFTVERISDLLDEARVILDGLGYKNIYYHIGDGTKGWEEASPPRDSFDKIVVSAAAPSIPSSLINQLADNGRLVIPTGSKMWQELMLVTKHGDRIEKKKYGNCTFVPLIGTEGWSKD